MHDCEKYPGRLKDLCLGRGLNGRPDPTRDAIAAFWQSIGQPVFTKSDVQISIQPDSAFLFPKSTMSTVEHNSLSRIGFRLADKIKTYVGAIPCGACKQQIIRLNSMTAEQIEADRENIISIVIRNASTSRQQWWLKLVSLADQCVTHGEAARWFIGKMIDDAIREERDATI